MRRYGPVQMLTLSQAAKEVKASRATIQRAIKSGKLSANKTEAGYQIVPAELFRVFEPVSTQSPAQSETVRRSGPPDKNVNQDHVQALIDAAVKDAKQEAEIEALRKETARLEGQLSDLKQERDDWKEQAQYASQATHRLLEDHSKPPPQGWLNKLLGHLQSQKVD